MFKIWEVETGKCIQTFEGHTNEVKWLKVLRNGDVLSSSWREHEIYMWRLGFERPLKTFIAHRNGTRCFVQTSSGKLITGGEDQSIKFWSYCNVPSL